MVIQSKRVWIAGQFMGAQLVIGEGRIREILPYDMRTADEDCGDLRVLPGFLDIHTHGAYGFDTNDGEPEGLRGWALRIPGEGVTAFLPTTMAQGPEVLKRALKNVAAVAEEGCEGAEILGVHLEGPYLDPDHRGAQAAEALAEASAAELKDYQAAADGMIRYITFAPEHDEGFALLRYCRENGIVASMGHSSAVYEQAAMAVANGVSGMTHVYNGMTGYHHRAPGLVGAAFRFCDVYGEVICDGYHCHPAALHTFFQAKGKYYGIMVSDSMRAKGCPPGEGYTLGGQPVCVDDGGFARVRGTDTIAGSTLRLNEGLRILVEEAMVPFDAAVNSCTVNPARLLGLDRRKGKLAAGYDADVTVLGDDYSVIRTYCKGKRAWDRAL